MRAAYAGSPKYKINVQLLVLDSQAQVIGNCVSYEVSSESVVYHLTLKPISS